MFLFGGASGRAEVGRSTRCAMPAGRALVVGAPGRGDQDAARRRGRGREPAARVRRADPRAGPALPAAVRRERRSTKNADVPAGPALPRSRRSPRAPRTRASLFEVRPIVLGGGRAPPPPADALAAFVAPAPPAVAELAAADAGAHRPRDAVVHAARARASTRPRSPHARATSLAIDPAEFDVDDTGRPRSAPDELPPGASSGLLLHDVLEVADLDARAARPDRRRVGAPPARSRSSSPTPRATRGIDPRLPRPRRASSSTRR